MNISVAIVRIISGFAVISLPTYLNTMNEIMLKGPKSGPSKTFDACASIVSELSQWLLLPLICYAVGGLFILMGIMSMISIIKESKNANDDNASVDTSFVKLETENNDFNKESLNQIGRDYDFENKYLNDLAQKIQEKVKYLSNHNFLKGDTELKLIVEGIDSEYLFRIHQTYLDIPTYKRGDEKKQNSPFNSVSKQLNLILKGLDEAENRIVNNSIMNQKANEIFLKEKLASFL